MKMPFQSLKNHIPICQIQRIFWTDLINCKKRRIPSCKSIRPQKPDERALQDTEKLWDLFG